MSSEIKCICAGLLFADIGCSPISHLPIPGELTPTQGISLTIGGCAANVAVNLARLEVPTGLTGCVGDDVFSRSIEDALVHPLIDQKGVRVVPGRCPGMTMIVNVEHQDRRFISTNGANDQFSVEDIPSDWANSVKILYVGGFLMMPKLETEKTAEFFRQFRRNGGIVVLDVVLFGERPYWDALRPLLPETDVFMPNSDEGKLISGLDSPRDQARFFADAGAKVSILTCGEQGTIYYSEKEKFQTSVFPVNFVGGTGAGDAFDAGFIAEMLCQKTPFENPVELVRRGSAQGYSCVRAVSATESVFTRQESDAFLSEHELKVDFFV